ncbi:ATP-binding protein [Pandoraea pulmonicola]|uniref:AAA family ATPase n=1 Tax=Pandoraea pulmonicola TaxID=93221 RepID=A0AAJ5D0Y5_PANPU|nr:ATP-binding protein [Pandoraea pulmonicola]AJC20413.1 AAA family ATPase [Pandoraea pulmonicola]SUA91191.1 Predicted ATPase (AAA+ superfamily) [Pandoraea pulmonicola]
MEAIQNPFNPGAGAAPPVLCGRDDVRETVHTCIERLRSHRHANGQLLVGLRGVGKTALLERLLFDAEQQGAITLHLEAPGAKSLPASLAPALRLALLRMSRTRIAKDAVTRGLRALAGFVAALKVTYRDIEVGLDFTPEAGLADCGSLELDLCALLVEVGRAAQSAQTVLAIFIDELQRMPHQELAALLYALHRCTQLQLPVILIGAGLPPLIRQIGNAKSYAERMFEIADIGPLAYADARDAIMKPAAQAGVDITADALDEIVTRTGAYPYFLQQWGKLAWRAAKESPITSEHVHVASIAAIEALDRNFYRLRFERLTIMEKRYLRAMAELGKGPHDLRAVAAELGQPASALESTRLELVRKGMLYSSPLDDAAFTVPRFDEYLRRVMPRAAMLADAA